MIAIFWNCWGFTKASAYRTLRLLLNTHKPSILFLSEQKLSSLSRLSRKLYSLGFRKFHILPANGLSSGLALYWKDHIDLNLIIHNEYLINYIIFSEPLPSLGNFLCIHGPTQYGQRHLFCENLKNISRVFQGPWLLVGDFNSFMFASEKKGGRFAPSARREHLWQFADEEPLIDLGFQGSPYTWNNRISNKANRIHLDRG